VTASGKGEPVSVSDVLYVRKLEHQLPPAVGREQAPPATPRAVVERYDVAGRLTAETGSAANNHGAKRWRRAL
jgi:hypothetical protein